jgi:GNAT superfamily N-acetyltransferase
VAETDARIVGFLVASVRDTRGGPASSLDGVFVMPESRRLGIGAALMRHFLQWHHESGRKEASVAVAPGNEQAVQLYRQAGFVPTTVVLTLSSR